MTLIHHYVIPVYAFISSCLDYCKALFSCPTKAFINWLQTKKLLLRLLTHAYTEVFTYLPVFKASPWLPWFLLWPYRLRPRSYIIELLRPYSPGPLVILVCWKLRVIALSNLSCTIIEQLSDLSSYPSLCGVLVNVAWNLSERRSVCVLVLFYSIHVWPPCL